jgi:hypothetical protein
LVNWAIVKSALFLSFHTRAHQENSKLLNWTWAALNRPPRPIKASWSLDFMLDLSWVFLNALDCGHSIQLMGNFLILDSVLDYLGAPWRVS